MTSFAMIFPGQGSQSIGMMADLAESFEVVRHTFEEASDALGMNLWALTQQGPLEQLNSTRNTQPAMLCAGVATWRLWEDQGGAAAAMMAGHSLGEYAALVAAGVIPFTDAIRLVAERGRLMQQAVPEGSGAMAAILGLDDDKVSAVCEQAAGNEVAAAVNFNSPGQVVIAGHATAIERAVALASEAGAKRVMMLDVSVPSHCALMRDAADELYAQMQEIPFSAPRIPVIHNASVTCFDDPEQIRLALKDQLYSPVRWVETVRLIADEGIETLVEAGPGKVLAGLTKRIDKTLKALPIIDGATFEKALEVVDG